MVGYEDTLLYHKQAVPSIDMSLIVDMIWFFVHSLVHHIELNRFQHSDDGELQGRDDYEDTKKVYKILHTQSDIKHMMNDYVQCHHEETFDMSDVWMNSYA